MDGVLRRDRDRQRLRIGVADVLGREDHHAARDEQRILARLEHAHQPVDRRVGIAAAHALDERGDDVVVLLAALVVEQRPLLRGLLERAPGRCVRVRRARARCAASSSVAERDARVALRVRERGTRARPARASSCARPRPRSASASARSTSVADRPRRRAARSTSTRVRDSSGGDHLERRVLGGRADEDRPCRASTCGRNASCCALLKRWISSTKSSDRLAGATQLVLRVGDDLAQLLHARAARPRTTTCARRSRRRGAAPASSCPCRAGPTGSATAGCRRRADRAGRDPGRAGGAGRRTRRACAAACARRAARARASPPRRTRAGTARAAAACT